METVMIHGQSIELEQRVCENGCGMSFKVMPNSPTRTARSDCKQVCLGEKWSFRQVREIHSRATLPEGAVANKKSKKMEADKKIESFKIRMIKEATKELDAVEYSDLQGKLEVASWYSYLLTLGVDCEQLATDIGCPVEVIEQWVTIKREVGHLLSKVDCENIAVLYAVASKPNASGLKPSEFVKAVKEEKSMIYDVKAKEILGSLKTARNELKKLGSWESKDSSKLRALLDDITQLAGL